MIIHFLGTSSGTEPIQGAYHQSMAIQIGECVYFFDAGEGCSRRAHLGGIDILKTEAVFITHTHMDHVGGLGNLLWNMRKLHFNIGTFGEICPKTVYIPDISTYNAFMQILHNSEGGFDISFDVTGVEYGSGLVHRDDVISVEAFPTAHMGVNPVRSYGFVIKSEGKKIVLSGDLASLCELDDAIGEYCDVLICETGHFKVSEVCEYARGRNVGRLCFSHNHRTILADIEHYEKSISNIFGDSATICRDGMKLEL